MASHAIGIIRRAAGAVEGDPHRYAVIVSLRSVGLETVVASQEGNGAAHGFKVVSASAAGAGVDQHAGMALPQPVPIRKKSSGIFRLGNPNSARLVFPAPVPGWIHVEVLAIEIDPLCRDQIGNVIGHPREGLGISPVEEALAGRRTEEPFGVMNRQPGARPHALRLDQTMNFMPFL